MKQQISLTLILFVFFLSIVSGQSDKPIFVGIQPNITVEPFYEEGELDVDILPIVVEMPVSPRATLKLTPIVNYHIGGLKNGVSDVGIFMVMPYYFMSREMKEAIPFGFYVGPAVGFGRNLINSHYTTTIAIEPGYMFETKKQFTISLGVQLGASFFSYDKEPNKWLSHWGPKISFGFWL